MVIGTHVGTGFGPSSDSLGDDVAAREWKMAAPAAVVGEFLFVTATAQLAGEIEERNRWQVPNG
jgi:hypothetical protein